MAKVMLIFEDVDDAQMISCESDRGISLSDPLDTLTKAEIVASTAMRLLDEYLHKCGANVEYTEPVDLN